MLRSKIFSWMFQHYWLYALRSSLQFNHQWLLQLGISKIFSSMFLTSLRLCLQDFLLKLDSSLMLLERPQVTARNFFFQNQKSSPITRSHTLSVFFMFFQFFLFHLTSGHLRSSHLALPEPISSQLIFMRQQMCCAKRIACRHTVQTTMHSLEIWETTCLLNAQIYQFTVFRCLTGIR